MARPQKRIGLILASIHTGSSLSVWPSFVRAAAREGANLFIFPGGRLNARADSANLRNPVYSLVNRENLDGLISWASTIHYTEAEEEFEEFHRRFEPLPFVTLSYKIPGHPCVEFDSYNGMKALVNHCILSHGARRIAFLRGPVFHRSAEARYGGYLDALKEAGLPAAPSLVSEPVNWDGGEEAAAQLLEGRGLVPGRDFDTLIGASDLMVFGAVNYFTQRGYHLPRDYHAGGFNNSGEGKLLERSLSTVHMPYAELGAESFRILLNLLGQKLKKTGDVLLRAEPIIRESCGCTPFGPPELSPGRAPPRDSPGRDFAGREEAAFLELAAKYLKLGPGSLEAQALPLGRAFFSGGEGRFFPLFEKALARYFDSGREAENLLALAEAVFSSGLIPEERRRAAEPLVYRTIFKVQERRAIHDRYEKEKWNTALNSLKCELLGTRDRNSLIRSLARHLPVIGITTAALMLWEDEESSLCVGSFSPRGLSPLREQRFPARLLVPPAIREEYAGGIFMVQPLFIENQSLGYFIHNVSTGDGLVFEELRSAVSYALKGIFLLEELVRARKVAEQAERAKTEFLKALETELYDPLLGMMDKLEGLEKRLVPEAGAADAAARVLGELKALVASRETEAASLIDLTLARVDELYLRKHLFDPDELLPGIGAFPLLSGDTGRLAQCFSLIREEYGGAVSARAGRGGLSLRFEAGEKPGGGGKRRLFFAERVILIHGGEFRAGEGGCEVLLPWTTLSGRDPAKRRPSREDHVLVLSDPELIPKGFFDLEPVYDIEKAAALPGKTAFILWNADAAPAEDFVKISALRQRPEFTAVPFLCYGKGLSGKTLADAIDQAIRSPRKRTVLFIGEGEWVSRPPPPFGPFWEGIGEEIRIQSLGFFNETVAEISPSLIVVNSLSTEAAAVIRRHPLTVTVPIIMLSGRIDSPAGVLALGQYSRLILCHRPVAFSPEFAGRVRAVMAGEEILPPHTGALVKKTLLYFDRHAESPISRWKLAEAVNVSEDYLTRVFHRELGLSLWDYLNRYRVFLAAELLVRTNETIQEIAFKTGFQDQAYFCRVFKKIYGSPPGHLRKH
jgi:DNA-binding LacI/PurR family transcriptional regulator/AraC-like DNA-binding protein